MNLRDDLRTAWRSMRSTKALTGAALIVLTLGIGAAAVIALSLAAFLASAIPARRAAGIDPAVTLRSEQW